jgi:hypothetical protein
MPRSSILLQHLTRSGEYQTSRQFQSTAHTTVILSHAASHFTAHVCSARWRTLPHCHTLSLTALPHFATLPHCHKLLHYCTMLHALPHTVAPPNTAEHCRIHGSGSKLLWYTTAHCHTLPHCHTQLWLWLSISKSCCCDIDAYNTCIYHRYRLSLW